MKYLQFTVFVVVFAACLIEFGQAIDCYQCNSFQDQACVDEFKENDLTSMYLKPCENKNATMCRKIKQEVFYNKEWNTRYIRECAVAGTADSDCSDRTGTYKVKIRYCQCAGAGCNGAGSIKMTIMAAVIPLFVVLVTAFKKW